MNALSPLFVGLLVAIALSPADVRASNSDANGSDANANGSDANANANGSDADANANGSDANANANEAAGLEAAGLEKQAEKLEAAGALAQAAEVWAKLLAETDDLDTRVIAAYRSQKAFRAAATSERSPEPLCRAIETIQTLLAEDDLDASDREDFEVFLLEIDAELVISFNETCPLEHPGADLLAIGHRLYLAPPSPADSEPAAPQFTRKRGLALFAGSTLVTAGVGLLALGTYGLVEGRRATRDIIPLIVKDASEGFDRAELAHFESVRQRGLAGTKLAVGAGVGGGVALVAGAVVLGIVSRRARDERIERAVRKKERRLTRVQPHLSPESVGLSVRTRF